MDRAVDAPCPLLRNISIQLYEEVKFTSNTLVLSDLDNDEDDSSCLAT